MTKLALLKSPDFGAYEASHPGTLPYALSLDPG